MWQRSRTRMKSIMKRGNSRDQILFHSLSCTKWSFFFWVSIFLCIFFLLFSQLTYCQSTYSAYSYFMAVQIFNLKICLFNLFNLKSKYLLGMNYVLGKMTLFCHGSNSVLFSVSFFPPNMALIQTYYMLLYVSKFKFSKKQMALNDRSYKFWHKGNFNSLDLFCFKHIHV